MYYYILHINAVKILQNLWAQNTNYFECPGRRTNNATHFIFNTEHAVVNSNDNHQLYTILILFKQVTMERQTDRQTTAIQFNW